MFFKARFELASYGSEFGDSFILLKLMDKNQVMAFSKQLAKASKEADKNEDDIDKSLASSSKVMDMMYQIVANAFIQGEIFDGETEEQRPMKKDDLDSFPPAVIREVVQFIQGSLEKKA